MALPKLKKGDSVKFKTANARIKSGQVVGIVKDGETPNLEKFKDFKKPGLNRMTARDEKSFLVVCKGQLFWPKKYL